LLDRRLMVYLIYNSYQGKNIKAWEGRLKAMSTWLCCGEQVNTPMAKRCPSRTLLPRSKTHPYSFSTGNELQILAKAWQAVGTVNSHTKSSHLLGDID